MATIASSRGIRCATLRPSCVRSNGLHLATPVARPGLQPSLSRTLTPLRLRPTSSSQKCAGLPIPIVGWLFNPVVLAVLYALGALGLFRNFDKTNYTAETRARLCALWPVLFVSSDTFRKSFASAVLKIKAKDGQ